MNYRRATFRFRIAKTAVFSSDPQFLAKVLLALELPWTARHCQPDTSHPLVLGVDNLLGAARARVKLHCERGSDLRGPTAALAVRCEFSGSLFGARTVTGPSLLFLLHMSRPFAAHLRGRVSQPPSASPFRLLVAQADFASPVLYVAVSRALSASAVIPGTPPELHALSAQLVLVRSPTRIGTCRHHRDESFFPSPSKIALLGTGVLPL